jgi:hypothetical protein
LPAFGVRASADGFVLELPERWLEANPWTRMALKEETQTWAQAGFSFRLKASAAKGR